MVWRKGGRSGTGGELRGNDFLRGVVCPRNSFKGSKEVR